MSRGFIRRGLDHLYERGLYKTRSARINDSRLVLVVIAIAKLLELSLGRGKALRLRSVCFRLTFASHKSRALLNLAQNPRLMLSDPARGHDYWC